MIKAPPDRGGLGRDRLDRGGHQGHGRGGFGGQENILSVCANYFELICLCIRSDMEVVVYVG